MRIYFLHDIRFNSFKYLFCFLKKLAHTLQRSKTFLEDHRESFKPVVTSYSTLLTHTRIPDDYPLESYPETWKKIGKLTTLFRNTANGSTPKCRKCQSLSGSYQVFPHQQRSNREVGACCSCSAKLPELP